jgi:Ca2+-binding RTX toxin-like protein
LGGGGNDHLNGKGGPDYLECDGGTARGAKGSDTIEPAEDDCLLASGGAGADVVSFEQYSYPVVVTLDDLANDGSSFLNLNVRSDVEAVIGTPFADYLVGNGRRNDLSGDYGRDHISGGGGSDVLRGGNNNDVINGDAGADSLFGGPGDDSLDGGSGVDHCDQESGSGTSTNCEG